MHNIAFAIFLTGIIHAPFLETKATCVCLQGDIINNTLKLVCTVLDSKYPISFYKGNEKTFVARCLIYPPPAECVSLVNKSKIAYTVSKSQALLIVWDLNLIHINWTCARGSKNDESSSVLIKDTCSITENVCTDLSKTEETRFWIITCFAIFFMIASVIIKGRNIQWRPKVVNDLSDKLFLGLNVLTSFILLVTLVLSSYFLENTTEGISWGCIIAAIVGALIPYIQNLKYDDTP